MLPGESGKLGETSVAICFIIHGIRSGNIPHWVRELTTIDLGDDIYHEFAVMAVFCIVGC